MLMKTTMVDKEQLRYIKKFKTLLNVGQIDRNAELAMLNAYGVESCKDMTVYELIELCQKLELQVDPALAKVDKLRKRTIATINGWLETTGRSGMSIQYIKSIACRSSEVKEFNHISESALNSIIAEFSRKQKVQKKAAAIKNEIIEEIKNTSSLN